MHRELARAVARQEQVPKHKGRTLLRDKERKKGARTGRYTDGFADGFRDGWNAALRHRSRKNTQPKEE